jgi:hypothetical protein
MFAVCAWMQIAVCKNISLNICLHCQNFQLDESNQSRILYMNRFSMKDVSVAFIACFVWFTGHSFVSFTT